jgi:hypothetical protein
MVERYRSIRQTTLNLAAPLSVEDCALQSMPDASPVKWHLAHSTWFFETFLLEGETGYLSFDPVYRVLFNSYYNAVGEKHPRAERGMLSRPSLEDILCYDAMSTRRCSLFFRRSGCRPSCSSWACSTSSSTRSSSSPTSSIFSRAIR